MMMLLSVCFWEQVDQPESTDACGRTCIGIFEQDECHGARFLREKMNQN
jgi:hypothetical protein